MHGETDNRNIVALDSSSDLIILNLLKDVAVQLNCIALQLENLARANDKISTILLDRVQQPLETGIRSIIDHVRADLDRSQHSLQIWYKELAANATKEGFSKLEIVQKKLEDLKESINAVSDRLDEQEKSALKARTRYLLIVGAVTATIGLITAIVKLLDS